MTPAEAMLRAPAREWPEAAQRRGALAAAILLLLLAPATFGMHWRGLLVPWFLVMPALGLVLLGPGSLRRVLGSRPTSRAMAAAVAIGLANALLHLGLAQMAPEAPMARRMHHEISRGLADLSLLFVALATLVFPLIVDGLFLGVLWAALRRVLGPVATVLAAALAFALRDGLGQYREFPLLFLFGLALAWLRHRSGSLSPCLLAHSIYNLALGLAFQSGLEVVW